MSNIILKVKQKLQVFAICKYRFVRILFYRLLSTNKIIGTGYSVTQPVLLIGIGKVYVGADTIFGWPDSPGFYSGYGYIEARTSEAFIKIGVRTIFNNNCRIISGGAGITIGDDCLVGTDVEIIDSDFHNLEPDPVQRKHGASIKKPVVVGNNVFIGNGVRILKGVTIGDNSVVANGAVVASSIQNDVVVGGIPAKVIRFMG